LRNNKPPGLTPQRTLSNLFILTLDCLGDFLFEGTLKDFPT